MAMLEGNTQAELTTQTVEPASDTRQRRQMLIALGLLLVALVWVAVKDRAFWSRFLFPSTAPVEVESDDTSLEQPGSGSLTYRAPSRKRVGQSPELRQPQRKPQQRLPRW